MQVKWNSTTLSTVACKYEGQEKSTEECLQLLLQELTHLHHGFKSTCKSDNHFHNKLISACQEVLMCKLACFTPSSTISDFIHQLKSSISIYEHTHSSGSDLIMSNIMFTNCWYFKQDHCNHRASSWSGCYSHCSDNQWNNWEKWCFVCHKKNCWSTRHTKEERDESVKRIENDLRSKLWVFAAEEGSSLYWKTASVWPWFH